jgi:hypothetical protein
MTTQRELQAYEVNVYEIAEHWNFPVIVQARSSDEAVAIVRKQYGKGFRVSF